MLNLLDWLIQTVGVGENEKVRRKLYLKLTRLVDLHGDKVKRIILEAWGYAKAEANRAPPDHLFARTVRRKLIDAGLYHEPKPYDHMSGQELDRLFVDEAPLPLFDGHVKPGQTPLPIDPQQMSRADLVAWQIEQNRRRAEKP